MFLRAFFNVQSLFRTQLLFLDMVGKICHRQLDHGNPRHSLIRQPQLHRLSVVTPTMGKILLIWMLAFTHPTGFGHLMALAIQRVCLTHDALGAQCNLLRVAAHSDLGPIDPDCCHLLLPWPSLVVELSQDLRLCQWLQL